MDYVVYSSSIRPEIKETRKLNDSDIEDVNDIYIKDAKNIENTRLELH